MLNLLQGYEVMEVSLAQELLDELGVASGDTKLDKVDPSVVSIEQVRLQAYISICKGDYKNTFDATRILRYIQFHSLVWHE